MLESLASTATRVEMAEEPINYHREEEVVEDDDPGLPYFPNNPASLRFYPLYIPHDDHTNEKVVAPYIYYQNQSQEVVGCMKRGAPPYAAPVYIHTPNPVQLPILLTNMQIRQFARDNPWAYALDKVLRRLEDPRIDAEVSRLREKLRIQDKIQQQLDAIRRQERRLVVGEYQPPTQAVPGTQTPTTTVYVLSELQSSLTTVPLQEASDTTTTQTHGSRGTRARDPHPYMVWEVSSQQPGAQGGGLSHTGAMPQLWKARQFILPAYSQVRRYQQPTHAR